MRHQLALREFGDAAFQTFGLGKLNLGPLDIGLGNGKIGACALHRGLEQRRVDAGNQIALFDLAVVVGV